MISTEHLAVHGVLFLKRRFLILKEVLCRDNLLMIMDQASLKKRLIITQSAIFTIKF
jgi:hypothetical protein